MRFNSVDSTLPLEGASVAYNSVGQIQKSSGQMALLAAIQTSSLPG